MRKSYHTDWSSLLFAFLLVTAMQAVGHSQTVVISQSYGGGGNVDAILQNDFIELFNRGSVPVDVTGWTVQYASASGSSWDRTNLAGIIQPGQYYLIQERQGNGGSVTLPTPDAIGEINLSASSGKVALVNSSNLGASANNC